MADSRFARSLHVGYVQARGSFADMFGSVVEAAVDMSAGYCYVTVVDRYKDGQGGRCRGLWLIQPLVGVAFRDGEPAVGCGRAQLKQMQPMEWLVIKIL